MAQEAERSGLTRRPEPRRPEEAESSRGTPAEGRLLRMGLVAVGVLCLLQAALNVSLRLALPSEEDDDLSPLNGSAIADLCARERSRQNPPRSSCCDNLLKRLLRKYRALQTERDVLQHTVRLLTEDGSGEWGSTGELFQL